MQMSALFGVKNTGIFEIYGVFEQTRGEGVQPVRTSLTANILFCFFRAYFSFQILQISLVGAQKYF